MVRTDYAWLLRKWCEDGMITGKERALLLYDLREAADELDRLHTREARDEMQDLAMVTRLTRLEREVSFLRGVCSSASTASGDAS